MTTALSTTTATDIERVLIGGDLSRLTAEQRVGYYKQLCETVGLNPLTRPFDYLSLSGKTVLYAKKECTEQLRSIRKVSLRIADRSVIDDCYVVTAEATDATGRVDSATGAVSIANLKGEAKANALMKAETKAKRRVTLSICGLGMLDESEVTSIPGAKAMDFDPNPTPPINSGETIDAATGEITDDPAPRRYERITEAQAEIVTNAARAVELDLATLCDVYQIERVEDLHAENFGRAMDRIEKYGRNKAKRNAA